MKFIDFANSDSMEQRDKRIQKAKSAECTPLQLDAIRQTAVFSGTSGVYNTSIEMCECVDFARRKLPCKHMYRLAAECGLYDIGIYSKDATKIKRKITPREREEAFEKNIELIDTYDLEAQNAVHKVLSARYSNDLYVCENVSELEKPMQDGLIKTVHDTKRIIERFTQKRIVDAMVESGFEFPKDVKTKSARYSWCLENSDIAYVHACPECIAVTTDGTLEVAYMKTYSYMNKKEREEFLTFLGIEGDDNE